MNNGTGLIAVFQKLASETRPLKIDSESAKDFWVFSMSLNSISMASSFSEIHVLGRLRR